MTILVDSSIWQVVIGDGNMVVTLNGYECTMKEGQRRK